MMAYIIKWLLYIMCSVNWNTLIVVKQTISYVCQSWQLMKYDCNWKSRNNIDNRFVNHIVVINILMTLWKEKVSGEVVLCLGNLPEIVNLFVHSPLLSLVWVSCWVTASCYPCRPAFPALQYIWNQKAFPLCKLFFPFKRLTLVETRVSYF